MRAVTTAIETTARFIAVLMGVAALATDPATSETGGADVEEIVVYGRARQQVGIAMTASEGVVGYDDIQLPPLLRVGELVEVVPGMVATQHSGTGKANQYFLRGFNLDHGTDFAAHLDGVPVNLRTHGHGQGYLDLNFLIPDLVETAVYHKGAYDADTGDFSAAGNVAFSYFDRLPETTLQAAAGQDGYGRGALAGSLDAAGGTFTGALDLTVYDGPWDLAENLRQEKFYLSYIFPAAGGRARVGIHGYDGKWRATDQIPRRAVRSGTIGATGFIDPDLGGDTKRYAITGDVEFDRWQLGTYWVDYELSLFSNFTYLLDNPAHGDEFEQRDRRSMSGIWATGEADPLWADRWLTMRWGGELRFDDIDEVGLYGTETRLRRSTIRRDRVEELSADVWGEAEVRLTDRLRTTLGLRGDYYDWNVSALRDANGGSSDEHLVSPKLSAAYRLSRHVETYLSWARGFHSNDVRGATIAIDPGTGNAADPVDVLVASEGAEFGVRLEQGERFNATLVGFWLELDSELVFVGDAGTTGSNGATERFGTEATAFWRASDWLALNVAYTYTNARFVHDAGGGREIPGAVPDTFVVGVNAAWPTGLSASTRLRYLGEAPLIEDDRVRSDGSWMLNAGVAYRRGSLEFRVDVFNLLDSNDDDIAYFYASRLPGEPAGGVEDVHFHPLEPLSVRASVTAHWGA